MTAKLMLRVVSVEQLLSLTVKFAVGAVVSRYTAVLAL